MLIILLAGRARVWSRFCPRRVPQQSRAWQRTPPRAWQTAGAGPPPGHYNLVTVEHNLTPSSDIQLSMCILHLQIFLFSWSQVIYSTFNFVPILTWSEIGTLDLPKKEDAKLYMLNQAAVVFPLSHWNVAIGMRTANSDNNEPFLVVRSQQRLQGARVLCIWTRLQDGHQGILKIRLQTLCSFNFQI